MTSLKPPPLLTKLRACAMYTTSSSARCPILSSTKKPFARKWSRTPLMYSVLAGQMFSALSWRCASDEDKVPRRELLHVLVEMT